MQGQIGSDRRASLLATFAGNVVQVTILTGANRIDIAAKLRGVNSLGGIIIAESPLAVSTFNRKLRIRICIRGSLIERGRFILTGGIDCVHRVAHVMASATHSRIAMKRGIVEVMRSVSVDEWPATNIEAINNIHSVAYV